MTEAGALCLKNFGVKALGLEGSQDAAREGALQRALQELIAERGLGSRKVNACAAGFHVFSKFVKLPPVDTSKVTQIIQYEAQQNVPFPLQEVVWDYQITGTTPTGELEVFLVAIKSDIVEGLFRVAESSGMRLLLVDTSPAALCNAFRYNYGDVEGCTMLLDIGAKTSNVLFFEKGKYSSRGINIGANSITQDFAAEARMSFANAEQFKIAEGFVSLGGAYEEPENPRQAQISKVARQVMTRLHIQVNQTIQFYRGQQGGSAPQRLFLAGGASIMPYTAQFFSEKLNLPVEYFNPLRNVQIDPGVNLEDLARSAHALGEVVGLGLRNLAQCPIELNLMPKSIRQRQQFNQKKPYFVATVLSLVLALLTMGWFYDAKVVAAKSAELKGLQDEVTPLQSIWDQSLDPELQKINKLTEQKNQLTTWLQDRWYWLDLMTELRKALITSETRMEMTLRQQGKDAKAGLWIQSMKPDVPGLDEAAAPADTEAEAPRRSFGITPEMMRRYGLDPRRFAPGMMAQQEETTEETSSASTNEINTINLTLEAVNLQRYSPTANVSLANTFQKALQSCTNLFDPQETLLARQFAPPDESQPTFRFELTLKLKNPIKL
ncbi:MAG: pilus assembly protein PilM [Candidatus Omnitrophica bacterium]|nr:pilus assembly protein PilM [Candidatus Omnitrophota bacterium]